MMRTRVSGLVQDPLACDQKSAAVRHDANCAWSLRSSRRALWHAPRDFLYRLMRGAWRHRPISCSLSPRSLPICARINQLQRWGLIEPQRIRGAFNTLAASLERTIREKMQLAAKFVDQRQQERDLHDDLAQNLMSRVQRRRRNPARCQRTTVSRRTIVMILEDPGKPTVELDEEQAIGG
jgi:hypothetical protein